MAAWAAQGRADRAALTGTHQGEQLYTELYTVHNP